jgi:polyisoprenoid-binding protein YceI
MAGWPGCLANLTLGHHHGMKLTALSIAALACVAAATPPAQAQTLPAGPATYQLDPNHSFVTFEVLHFGTSTTRGRFGPINGEVTLDRAQRRGEVALRIPTAQVDTGIPVFNARLRQSDLLASTDHPEAFFVARQFRFEGEAVAEVRGEFTLRGVSQALSLKARRFSCRLESTSNDEICGGDFEGQLLRSDFGATFGLPLIGNRIGLLVQVEGRLRR